MCKFQYRKANFRQQCEQLSNDKQTTHSFVHSSLPKRDRKEEWVQFSTDGNTTHSNIYSSVQKNLPYNAMCKVQYPQTDHTRNCVQFSTVKQTKHSYVEFNTDRWPADNHMYSSVPAERLHTAMCAVQ